MDGSPNSMYTNRIEAVGDSIFAFAMTLLVLDLQVPSAEAGQMLSELFAMWPNVLGYLVSFALLGIYWRGHLLQMKYIQRSDHTSQWLNLIFFWSVTLLPFSTKMLSANPLHRLSLSLYAGNLILIGLLLFWNWSYATKNRRLVDEKTTDGVIKMGKIRCLLPPAAYFAAILLAFISPVISLVLFAAIPLVYIMPGLHHLWVPRLVKEG